MPRLIDTGHCPHCSAELPEPKPRVCPECMGSLQQRFLRAGCLSSAPPLLALALALGWMLRPEEGPAQEAEPPPADATPAALDAPEPAPRTTTR